MEVYKDGHTLRNPGQVGDLLCGKPAHSIGGESDDVIGAEGALSRQREIISATCRLELENRVCRPGDRADVGVFPRLGSPCVPDWFQLGSFPPFHERSLSGPFDPLCAIKRGTRPRCADAGCGREALPEKSGSPAASNRHVNSSNALTADETWRAGPTIQSPIA